MYKKKWKTNDSSESQMNQMQSMSTYYVINSSNDLFKLAPYLTIVFAGGDLLWVSVLRGRGRLVEVALGIGAGGKVSERRSLPSNWTQSAARLGRRALQRGAFSRTRRIARTRGQRRLEFLHRRQSYAQRVGQIMQWTNDTVYWNWCKL